MREKITMIAKRLKPWREELAERLEEWREYIYPIEGESFWSQAKNSLKSIVTFWVTFWRMRKMFRLLTYSIFVKKENMPYVFYAMFLIADAMKEYFDIHRRLYKHEERAEETYTERDAAELWMGDIIGGAIACYLSYFTSNLPKVNCLDFAVHSFEFATTRLSFGPELARFNRKTKTLYAFTYTEDGYVPIYTYKY